MARGCIDDFEFAMQYSRGLKAPLRIADERRNPRPYGRGWRTGLADLESTGGRAKDSGGHPASSLSLSSL